MERPLPNPGAPFVGREAELGRLKAMADEAAAGRGGATIVTGEPGIGKTRLVEAMRSIAASMGFTVLSGGAAADSSVPFRAIAEAMGGFGADALFAERERISFREVLLVDRSGRLLASYSREGAVGRNAGGFAGALSAVQAFAADAFRQGGRSDAALGRLEYGDSKVIVEHAGGVFIAGVMDGEEHIDMRAALRRTVNRIGELAAAIGSSDAGEDARSTGVQAELDALGGLAFASRGKLEGVKLETERGRISEGVLKRIGSIAAQAPVLVLMEDMHWADESSLAVLAYVARNIGFERVAVVATARPAEGAAFRKAVERMRAEGTITEIGLDRLVASEVAALIDSICSPNDFPPDFPRRLESDCAGNPFFVTETLRQMLADGGIVISGGSYSLSDRDFSVPTTIEGLVKRRLETLGEEAMAIAEYASCMGREFSVRAALSIPSIADPEGALSDLTGNGMVVLRRAAGGSERRGEFVHAYFQTVLYNGLTERWKAAHHRSLGEHFEQDYAGRLDAAAYDLARHFSRSREREKAYKYCMMAGELAEASYSPEEAAALYTQAISALEVGSKPARGRLSDACERLGDVHSIAGKYQEALDSYSKAAASADDGEARARLHRKRGRVMEMRSDYDGAIKEVEAGTACAPTSIEKLRLDLVKARVLQQRGDYPGAMKLCEGALEGLGLFGGSDADAARALSIMGMLKWLTGSYDEALAAYDRGIALARKVGDERLYGSIMRNKGIVHCDQGDYQRSLECSARAMEISLKVGDQWSLAACIGNNSVTYQRMGDLERAKAESEKGLKIYQRVGDAYGTGLSLLNLGIMNTDMGNIGEAEDLFGRSMSIGARIGNQLVETLSLYMLAGVHQERGELDTALGEFAKARDLFERSGDAQRHIGALLSLAALATEMGDPSEGVRVAEKALAMSREQKDIEGTLVGMLVLADSQLELGNSVVARGFAEDAEKIARESNTMQYHAVAVMTMANVDVRAGDHAAARRRFEEAHRELTECRSYVQREKLCYFWGMSEAASGDREAGGRRLRDALAFFEERGMKRWAERCRKALERVPDGV